MESDQSHVNSDPPFETKSCLTPLHHRQPSSLKTIGLIAPTPAHTGQSARTPWTATFDIHLSSQANRTLAQAVPRYRVVRGRFSFEDVSVSARIPLAKDVRWAILR